MKSQNQSEILDKVKCLVSMYQAGLLGGEHMPEDANPQLDKSSAENYLYFTLPMALNYQRNSYSLWEAALNTFCDPETHPVFDPLFVSAISEDELRGLLLKHKLALKKNKDTAVWKRLSDTFSLLFDGDIRRLFTSCHSNVSEILFYIQKEKKPFFPYLSGPKIANYWLYIMDNYTDCQLKEKALLSIAPDTHVVQSSQKLGLIDPLKEYTSEEVSDCWRVLLQGSEFAPIDIHTPLWLWSRSGFIDLV